LKKGLGKVDRLITQKDHTEKNEKKKRREDEWERSREEN